MTDKLRPTSRQYPPGNERYELHRMPLVPNRGTVVVYEYSPQLVRESSMHPAVLDLIARATVSSATRRRRDRHLESRKALVLLLSPRPRAADIIGLSLKTAGADCSRVLAHPCRYRSGTGDRSMRLPDDAGRLRNDILASGADLVVIDPLNELLDKSSGVIERQRFQNVRLVLEQIASETEVAIIVGVVRIDVGTSKESAAYSSPPLADGSGRNLSRQQSDVKQPSVRPIPIERLRRNSRSPADARQDVLNAIEFLKRTLADRPRLRRDIETVAMLRGIKPRTLRTAREKLGIVVWKDRVANGRWVWELPPADYYSLRD